MRVFTSKLLSTCIFVSIIPDPSRIVNCRWMKHIMPERCGVLYADMKLKLFFGDTNLARIVAYDRNWPNYQISIFSLVDVVTIDVLSRRLGLESPVPKVPLTNNNPRGKFGWEGSTNFHIALVHSKELATKKPSSIQSGAIEYVVQELQEAAASSHIFGRVVDALESGIATGAAAAGGMITRVHQPSLSLLSAETSMTSPLGNASSMAARRKNRRQSAVNTSVQTTGKGKNRSDRSQIGSHQLQGNKVLSASTKAIMSTRVNSLTAMSAFGSILAVSGAITFLERWYLRRLICTIFQVSALAEIVVKKLTASQMRQLHQVSFFIK